MIKPGRLLILPAGMEQVPVIRRAKEKGLFVVAIHASPAGEGLEFADAKEIASPQDSESCLRIAEKYRVHAVLADQCDYSLFTSACIAQKLGIPGPSLRAAQNSTNKKIMRLLAEKAGLLQPAFRICRTMEEAEKAASEIGYPVILKPTDNRGCFGVTRVESREDLENAFFEALWNAHSREILVEQFLEGTMVTVDGYFFNADRYRVLGIASKKKIDGKKCVDMEVMYPAELPEGVIQDLKSYNQRLVQALGLAYGPTHGEYLVSKEGQVYLIELANRGGGVLTAPLILPTISRVDVPELLIRNAFGEFPVPEENAGDRSGDACVLSFIDFGVFGFLKAIHGLEKALQIPGVLAIHFFAKIGQELPAITHGPSRHGFIIAKASSRESARNLVSRVMETIHLETRVV